MVVLVDRSRELRVLDEEWSSGRSSLVVVYGRRRIGKTFLVTAWARLRRLNMVYLVFNYSDPGPALMDIEEQLEEQLGVRPRLDDLRGFASLLSRLFCGGRRVIVLDEFQRLGAAGLAQLLQEAWDRAMSRCGSGSMLVLSGSSVGMMERLVLEGGAPLYGRATRVIRLSYMELWEAYPFLRRLPGLLDAYLAYAVLGGVPYYLSLLEPGESVEEALWSLLFAPGAPLQDEPEKLLRMELREPDRYLAIMEAVARGRTRLSEIASAVGLPATSLPRYIRVLEEMEFVEHVKPLGERRRGVYRLRDRLARLWLGYVAPRRRLLELGMNRQLHRLVTRRLGEIAARAWEEDAAQHFLRRLEARGELVLDAGPYWRRGIEIDYVVLAETPEGERRLYGLEAKWSSLSSHEAARETEELRKLLERLPWTRRGYAPAPVLYARSLEPPGGDAEHYTLEDVMSDAATDAVETRLPVDEP